jgi:hypothetical protein
MARVVAVHGILNACVARPARERVWVAKVDKAIAAGLQD